MTPHEQLRPLISSYLDGELNAAQKESVEKHILECPQCLAYVKELQALSAALKKWPNESLSPDFEQKVVGELSQSRSMEGTMKKELSLSYWKVGSGAVGVLVILLAATVVFRQPQLKGGLSGMPVSSLSHTQVALLEKSEPAPAKDSKEQDGARRQLAQIQPTVPVTGAKVEAVLASVRTRSDLDAQLQPRNVMGKLADKGRFKSASNEIGDEFSIKKEAVMGLATREFEFRGNSAVPAAAPAQLARANESYDMADSYEAKQKTAAIGGLVLEERDEPIVDTLPGRNNPSFNTEGYDRIYENPFLESKENPLSTFSIDVDTASYSNVRRYLNSGVLPPKDAVRIEELINYFSYDYPQPSEGEPFSITTEIGKCPWNPAHQLALIGLKGKEIKAENAPASNLVFLIDVSGSMDEPNKLPLVKSGLKLLVDQLRESDRVAIVVYAGAAGLVLESTPGSNKERLRTAIDNLQAGGSTAGGAGIQLAYSLAAQNVIKSGNNRVILATDGDFNVGTSSDGELTRMIEEKREQGIFLSVLGFGTGNYQDSKMEKLADKGNGNYAYIDTIDEARKVLVNEMGSTIFTIAKDVKLQIEFNPSKVKAYRLVGYENRMLAKEDFNDDKKDAGELGAGHEVTALYEIVAPEGEVQVAKVDELQYQQTTVKASDDLMTVKLRYKQPEGTESKLITNRLAASAITKEGGSSTNFRFASAVAEFGLLLRDSEYKGTSSYLQLLEQAKGALGDDRWGYRAEFLKLVEKAGLLNR